jgi:hypothetical protein
MASLRGTTQVWTAASGAAITQNAVSKWAYVGTAPYVTIFIKNGAVAATFKIQVAGQVPDKAGLNEIDAGLTDGGLSWYDYHASPSTTELSLPVGISGFEAFDLSPFSPSLLRLFRTDASGASNVEAFVAHNGAN